MLGVIALYFLIALEQVFLICLCLWYGYRWGYEKKTEQATESVESIIREMRNSKYADDPTLIYICDEWDKVLKDLK